MTDLKRFQLNLRTDSYAYRTPMKFGGRIVNDVTVLSVDCQAESLAGSATGLGSMTMGVAWAWPSTTLADETKLELVLELAQRLAQAYSDSDTSGHPLDICHRMTAARFEIAAQLQVERGLAEPIPELAVLLAGSPIESALFDAHGKAAGASSYSLLSRDHVAHDLGHYLGQAYAGAHIGDWISPTPVAQLPIYHLVGALDPLTPADVDAPIGDGLPESLDQWIVRDGVTHLKIKLDGSSLDWDYQRIVDIDQVAHRQRSGDWFFSLDFNERCEDEEYVLELLQRLERDANRAMQRIQYIEQPTHRDLTRPGQPTMHRAAQIRPVVIDESLTGIESLHRSVAQGYSGIAIKACKGHADALLLAAAARIKNLFLCVQDLTCVGASLLHSASLAAHLPGAAAIESNGRQYAPAANLDWKTRFGAFFDVRHGVVPTSQLDSHGLGYGDQP